MQQQEVDALVGGYVDEVDDVDEDLIGGDLMDNAEVSRVDSVPQHALPEIEGGGDNPFGSNIILPGAADGGGIGDTWPSVSSSSWCKIAHHGLDQVEEEAASMDNSLFPDRKCTLGCSLRLPRGEATLVDSDFGLSDITGPNVPKGARGAQLATLSARGRVSI